MADFTLKQHDRLPSIQATLSTGTPPVEVDLTSALSVKFIMSSAVGGTVLINAAATIVDAANGVVRYDWGLTDTSAAGSFVAEWQVTWSGNKEQSFPTTSYHSIAIVPDLDGA